MPNQIHMGLNAPLSIVIKIFLVFAVAKVSCQSGKHIFNNIATIEKEGVSNINGIASFEKWDDVDLLEKKMVTHFLDTTINKFKFVNGDGKRYFFSTSAIPIKKNHGYYQNIFLTANVINYAFDDNFSFHAGLEFTTLALGIPIFAISPRFNFQISKDIYAGGGPSLIVITGYKALIVGQAMITYGGNESNVTVGAIINKNPFLTVSGLYRLSNKIALVSENFLIPDAYDNGNYAGIIGIRILSPKKSFDIGLILQPGTTDSFPVFPYLGFARVF